MNTLIKSFLLTLIVTSLITGSALAQPSQPADEQQIRTLVETMERGWNTKDGKVFASSFAPTHDYIVWDGLYFADMSQEQNAMGHQGLFNGQYKNQDAKFKIDKIKFLKNDIALVHLYGALYDTGKDIPADPAVLMSMVVMRQDGKWQIVSFHNLDLETITDPEHGKRMPMPANVMYKGWYNQQ